MFRYWARCGAMSLLAASLTLSCRANDDSPGAIFDAGKPSRTYACARTPELPLRPPEYPRAVAAGPDSSIIVLTGERYPTSIDASHTKRYDVVNNRWSDLPDPPFAASATGASTDTAAYFVVDDRDGLFLYPFDSASGSWGVKIPVPNLQDAGPYSAHVGALAVGRGRKLYITGPDVIYDETSQTFSHMAPMPDRRFDAELTLASDGNFYGISGVQVAYDTLTNRWALLPGGGLLYGAYSWVGDENGHVLALGGGTPSEPNIQVQIFDIATLTWSLGPRLPYAMVQDTSVLACDGRIYAFGNDIGMQRLDPDTMTWAAPE